MTPASALLLARSSSASKPNAAVDSRRTTKLEAWVIRLVLAVFLFTGVAVAPLWAQTAEFAGVVTSLGGGFSSPNGVAVDASGNVYVADSAHSQVKEMPAGCASASCVTMLGGGFVFPQGVAVDRSGNVYVADSSRATVTEMPAGCTSANYANSLCAVTSLGSGFVKPMGVAVDSSGNVYVADDGVGRGAYEMPAGCKLSSCVTALGGDYGTTYSVAVDIHGNVYVSDDADSLVKEIPAGCTAANFTNNLCTVTTLGGGAYMYEGLAVDSAGNVYASYPALAGVQEIPAGCTVALYQSDNCTTRVLAPSSASPDGLAVDSSGNVYAVGSASTVEEIIPSAMNLGSMAIGQTSAAATLYFSFTVADTCNSTVSICAVTDVSTSALTQGAPGLDFADSGTGTCDTNGKGHAYYTGDGCTVNATFTPKFAGSRNGAIELLNSSGSAIAAGYVYGTGVAPQLAFTPFTQTTLGGGFTAPYGVTVDAGGNIYVADSASAVAYKMPAGCSSSTCVTTQASGFGDPEGVALDGAGNLYVADDAASGDVEEVSVGCGSSTCSYFRSGGYSFDVAVALDGRNDVFFIASGEPGNGVYEDPAGCLGDACITFRGGLNQPMGLAVDTNDNIYIADTGNNAVKEMPLSCLTVSQAIPGACTVTTLGGDFSGPTGVALDPSGNIYVADYGNGAVKVMPAGCLSSSCVSTLPGSFVHPRGVALDQSGNIYVTDLGNPPQSSPAVYELTVTTPPCFSFANTNVGSQSTDSPQTATVRNIGNAPLTFPVPLTGENPSVSANFTLDASTTCPQVSTSSSAGTLAAGANCNLAVDFIPTTDTGIAGSVTLTDNTLNANPAVTQSIGLSGTGLPAVSVTIGTNPAGLSFSINGTPYTATQTPSLPLGTPVALATTATQPGGTGVQYVFSQWSDGTTTTTDTLTPTTSTTGDTAQFTTQYLLTVTAGSGGTVAGGSPNGFYTSGTTQGVFTATPNPGYYFTGWTGANSPTDLENATSPGAGVNMNGPENLIANFAPIPTYIVTTTADTNDGACVASLCSFRDAITAANANNEGAGTITFSSTVFASTNTTAANTITLTSALPKLFGQIAIQGPGAKLITLSGNNSSAVGTILTVVGGSTVSISGLTVANGNAGEFGGGLINDGTLTIADCVFSNNTAFEGGGAIANNRVLTVLDSAFTANTGLLGGAIYGEGSTVTVNYSTFSGNISSGNGGAIRTAGSLVVSNSTFTGNTAAESGGAIAGNFGPTITMSNSIVSGNSASTGAGVANQGGPINGGNNLFYQNYDVGTTNEDDCYGCTSNTNPISGNPNLAPLGNYGGPTPSMLPLPNSAAICAGAPSLIPNGVTSDQRGLSNSTTYDGAACYDLGAVQTNYSLSLTSTPPPTGTSVCVRTREGTCSAEGS